MWDLTVNFSMVRDKIDVMDIGLKSAAESGIGILGRWSMLAVVFFH